MYIENHPILKQDNNQEVTFFYKGTTLKANHGQTIAGALMANGIKKFGITRKLQQSRGLYCANGRCCSCFVTVNGLEHVLSCMTLIEDGMEVSPNSGDPDVRRGDYGN
ncbi:(2Fe-2S)-binding protein [Halobacillus naozhouensis]|uniref:(2Fe-2S)-binding protein n=1 Tax=Halobacillus naozhouensis TaxID=554880 RepID=A0ABY8IVN9_9BACI|nr:(2Fe-2S)-binding protein [Halobacillus naozhouensis]WFT74263.1 (2Fe-2S)-binding protein [Halobacillus naozhouensis]